jgi:Alpha/beta hydrolase domain
MLVLVVALAMAVAVPAAGAAPAGKVATNYPPVDLSELTVTELPAGTPTLSSTAVDPSYEEHEYVVRGVASTYSGPVTGPVEVAQTRVPYATRVLVRVPKDPKHFSGRVVLEPFNTSGEGKDLAAMWGLTSSLLQQRGDAWVGVTDRTSAGEALKSADPARYADVDVPSNDVAWDALAQVGAAIKRGGASSPLPGVKPEYLYMTGYSQSGVDTAGFANALAKHYGTAAGKPVYDGYFPAAHAASVTPLQSSTSVIPKFEYPVWTAVGVPVVNLEDGSGLEGFTAPLPEELWETLGQQEYTSVASAAVRRADSDEPGDQYRLYEVAGMPHGPGGGNCEGPPSTFPGSAVTRGALNLLNRWVEQGKKPPRAPRVKMAEIDDVSKMALDQNGNAIGGVRSPYLDEALVRYDVHARGIITCQLAGHEAPLDQATLVEKYEDANTYMKRFTRGLDAMIKAGYVLKMDRAQLLADQQDKATEVLGG